MRNQDENQGKNNAVAVAVAQVADAIGKMNQIASNEYHITARKDGYVCRQLLVAAVDNEIWIGTKHFDSRSGKPDGESVSNKYFSIRNIAEAIEFGKQELIWVLTPVRTEASHSIQPTELNKARMFSLGRDVNFALPPGASVLKPNQDELKKAATALNISVELARRALNQYNYNYN